VLAAISLDFEPSFRLFGRGLRLETVALAGAVFVALVLAGLGAGRLEARLRRRAAAAAPESPESPGSYEGPRLRRDDLLLIALGAIPGAVLGGRLEYGLIHLDYYRSNPSALLDPSQGGLALTGAVVLGVITALAVARLLSAPIHLWLHVASVPLLVALGLGKLAMVLGGAGQGRYSEASWGTFYSRPGPWVSGNAGLPALPSQALEGGLVLAVAVALVAVPVLLRLRLRRWHAIARPALSARRRWSLLEGGRRFAVAMSLFWLARFATVFTWRDAQVIGPLRAEHLVLLGLAGICAGIFAVLWLWHRVQARRAAGPTTT
jgi:prolipoprotein diacylglyceryltransferase